MSILAIPMAVVALGVVTSWSQSDAVPPSPAPSVAPSPSVSEDYDEPPKPLKLKKPVYPKEPFYAGVEGTVLVEFVVDETGHVTNATVKESVPGLDEAALDCVKQWTFSPARKGGTPVASVAHAPVKFTITGRKKKK